MKKELLFALMGLVMMGSFSSCNNKPKEPTQEEVQEMKQALADSVLAQIDALVDEYSVADENGVVPRYFELTEKEKQVKPDYLLDPSEANNFVTKSQKVNAMAIYAVELAVREIYGMPVEETKAAITKLAAEVNYPLDFDKRDANLPLSERTKATYEKCKENGELALFWQFQNAIIVETSYILVNNPELFYGKISEKQWKNYCQRKAARDNSVEELAMYDEEMATLLEFLNKTRITKSDEERTKIAASLEFAKQFFTDNKDKFIARRNAMLQ